MALYKCGECDMNLGDSGTLTHECQGKLTKEEIRLSFELGEARSLLLAKDAELAKMRAVVEAARWLAKNCEYGFFPTRLDVGNPQEVDAFLAGKQVDKSSGDSALRQLLDALAAYDALKEGG